MEDYLTSKQVQDILKVDRITIYRMLQDGRLKGVKIGQQWRFSTHEVQRLIGGQLPSTAAASGQFAANPPPPLDPSFPTHCVQTVQDLFSTIGQVSSLVVDMDGAPITQASSPCGLCQHMLTSQTGKEACRASWKAFAAQSKEGGRAFTCHAGLNYTGAPIFDSGEQIGLFLSGEFYLHRPDEREETLRIRRLAQAFGLSFEQLFAAARAVPVISQDQHARMETWPFTAARAVESILLERTRFMGRLQQIASLTQIS